MAAQSSNLAGWTGPKYQPANQEDEEKLMGKWDRILIVRVRFCYLMIGFCRPATTVPSQS